MPLTVQEEAELLALLEEQDRREQLDKVQTLGFEEANEFYASIEESDHPTRRYLCQVDVYYLLAYECKRKDVRREWLFKRSREVDLNPDGFLDLWSRDHYKAVDINEPILTTKGWSRHGDLSVGDYVFGPDGKPTEVIAKTETFTDADCYKVCFDDGYSVVVSGEHLWTVDRSDKSRIPGTNKRRKWKNETINTVELFDEIERCKKAQTRPFPFIPTTAPIEHETQDLKIDPYLLGVWLGDGDSSGARITSGTDDAEEMASLIGEAEENVKIRRHPGHIRIAVGSGVQGKKGTSDFVNGLRHYGVFGDKHIPDVYLMADAKQRFSLLQGLMDTDGSCNKDGQAIFCAANERLANQVFDLVLSLGYRPSIGERAATYRGEPRKYWQVIFTAYQNNPPFRLKRKIQRCSRFDTKISRKIKYVERVATVPVSCIQVDRKDGLYLIGRHLVTTHNSTIITYAKTIQEILKNPDITIGIFSHTRPIAKAFLDQIKREFEANEGLKALFPDVLHQNPAKESDKWSLDSGIIVKRKTNPKECTVEAWGLVDGQPTGKHFMLRVYDDVVTLRSVGTPDQIRKTTDAWALSLNLGSQGGRVRYIGTRYHRNDSYKDILGRGAAIERRHGPTAADGSPNLLTKEELEKKRREMGPYIYACQMEQNPTSDSAMSFKQEWLRHYKDRSNMYGWNLYILCDPAGEKKKTNDYTVIAVVGLAPDKNYYLVDGVRDRMNLTERTDKVFEFHRTYNPLGVGYEKYGMQSDIEHIKYVQEHKNYRFDVTPLGGPMPKNDRIRQLMPVFEQGRFYIPDNIRFVDYEKAPRDFVKDMLDEYHSFPVSEHDDVMDCIARIVDSDLNAEFPRETTTKLRSGYDDRFDGGWMGS